MAVLLYPARCANVFPALLGHDYAASHGFTGKDNDLKDWQIKSHSGVSGYAGNAKRAAARN